MLTPLTPVATLVRRQRPRSLTDMFKGSYANAFLFGSQLYDFRFGSSCCTSVHTFHIFRFALRLGFRFRVVFKVYNGITRVQYKTPSDPTLSQKRAVFPAFSLLEVTLG